MVVRLPEHQASRLTALGEGRRMNDSAATRSRNVPPLGRPYSRDGSFACASSDICL